MNLLTVAVIVVIGLIVLIGLVLWFVEKRRLTRGGSGGRPRK